MKKVQRIVVYVVGFIALAALGAVFTLQKSKLGDAEERIASLQNHTHETTCEAVLGSERWTESEVVVRDVTPYTGTPAEVNFDNPKFPDAKTYRTKISEAVQQGPNFAGKYTVAEWGCGESCQNAAVINAETGEILYYGLRSVEGYEYSLEEPLLVVNPGRDSDATGEYREDIALHKATWTRDYFFLLDYGLGEKEELRIICREGASERLKDVFSEG